MSIDLDATIRFMPYPMYVAALINLIFSIHAFAHNQYIACVIFIVALIISAFVAEMLRQGVSLWG